jgi:CRP/FNR family transcriptional regulator, cyclic AMP receptor protein
MEHSSRRRNEPVALLRSEGDAEGASPITFSSGRQPNIFLHLTAIQRNKVMERGVRHRLSPGETLFAQGEHHKGVYLIEKGLVRTFYTSPAGREITLAYWQAGNLVGTPKVLDTPLPGACIHQWSGMAAAETSILAFRGEQLRELIEKLPSFAIGIVETLEFKGKCLSSLVQMLGTRSVAERLAMLLYNLAELHGVQEYDGIVIGQPFTHEVLAQMVGASRQWVTMTLNRFEREGLVRTGKRHTLIFRPERLLSPPKRRAAAGKN